MVAFRPPSPVRLWTLVLAFGVAVGVAAWWSLRRPEPYRVVLTAVETSGDGLEAAQRRALRDWVQWQLEAGGCTVLLPGSVPPQNLPPRTEFLELRPKRTGDQLALGWRRAKAGALAKHGDAAWSEVGGSPQEPSQAMRRLARSLPLPQGERLPTRLLTHQPATFWRLIEAVAGNRDSTRLEEGYRLAQEATQAEPECAMAWMVLGDIHYRRMLLAPQSDPMGQVPAEHHFRKALELAPAMPQAIFLLAELKVDSGDHAQALEELELGLRAHPQALSLRTALVYTARTAGLMELTRAALKQVDDLAPSGLHPTTAENAWLYLGDRPRFEASLQAAPGEPRNTVAAFYQGYLALADGHRDAAAAWFHRSRTGMASYTQFADLAEVYEGIATQQLDAAKASLARLSASRTGLRVPDGEFTFKLAEAHALLGEPTEAQEAAEKAFAQGFGCTDWYERSPFLGSIRGTPRWRALLSHLLARQGLLERTYPPSVFA